MKVLIIGGTLFLGRYLVEQALKNKHQVTIFHRGKTNPGLFADVEEIMGDRNQDLYLLADRQWDLVIDTCGYTPETVHISADYFKDKAKKYVFISTISVYADFKTVGIDENYPVGVLENPADRELNGATYGPLKALCEAEVVKSFADKALIVRPGLIVGPWDPSDRFTYWIKRVHEGGKILAPLPQNKPIQFIEAKDLAEWVIQAGQSNTTGTFNLTGPDYCLTMGEFLNQCKQSINPQAEFVWVEQDLILENEIQPWTELTLWVPEAEEYAGDSSISIKKALQRNLTFTPLAQTIEKTYHYYLILPETYKYRAGLDSLKEAEFLEKLGK